MKASQAQEVVLEGIRATRPVRLMPHVLGGVGRTYSQDPSGSGTLATDHHVRETGVALRYGLTNNLLLDLTYNTDFAQVEADDAELNPTRFSIQLPEKRPFFLERASAFDFALGDGGRLFYSRRIGIEDGRQVPVLGGARLVGRAGQWDVGLMSMQTEATEDLATENFGVLRARRRVLDDRSYVGVIGTARVGGGRSRTALGSDALLHLFDQDFLTLTAAASTDDAAEPDGEGDGGYFLRALWERRGVEGLGYSAELARVERDFAPPVGFIQRTGHLHAAARIFHGWRMGANPLLYRHVLGLQAGGYRREDSGWESATAEATWDAELKSGRRLSVDVRVTHEDLLEGFALSPEATVPSGRYDFYEVRLRHAAPYGAAVRADGQVEFGPFYDGWKAAATLRPAWNIPRHLELGGLVSLMRIRFPEREQDWTARLARVSARAMFNTRLSLTGFLQYSSAVGSAVANLRLRYNPGEGHDLYLVFDEGLSLGDGIRAFAPQRTRQALLLKYSRAITLEFPR